MEDITALVRFFLPGFEGANAFTAFYNYFYEQNQLIENGTTQGIQLNFNSLGVGNGIISEAVQAP